MDKKDHSFKTKSWKEDLTIIVEGEKLHVSKAVLGLVSPVFEKMFEGNFKEKNLEEIKLPGKKLEEFVEFLCCIYPNVLKEITDGNVFRVLPLAHEYQTEQLLARCEQFLKTTTDKGSGTKIFKHLAAAHTFQLKGLQHMCIELASFETCEDLQRWTTEHGIPAELSTAILFKAFAKSEIKVAQLEHEHNTHKRCFSCTRVHAR